MLRGSRNVLLLVAFGLSCLTIQLNAQSGNASLSGRITDPSGAIIIGAAVTVDNIATNVSVNTQTNNEGHYSLTGMIPGEYKVTIASAGFRTSNHDGITLRVGDRLALDVSLEVGSATERVTISAEAPLIRTEDAQSGLVIDNKRIQDLPQYNRDPLAFVFLAPNVTGTSQNTFVVDHQ